MSKLKGINIGIDLGSTNSSVFIYDLDDKKAMPVDIVSGSPLVPSVVSFDKFIQEYDFGINAKNAATATSVITDRLLVFKAFKMLLAEQNPDILKDRNYDEVPDEDAPEEIKQEANTPENITKVFIKYMLETVLEKKGADYFKNLVVGFPEVWNNVETIGARFVLREICNDLMNQINAEVKAKTGMTVKSNVAVRTEPECASAFIAKQIEQETGTNYNGNLLIIDYGGGTLDITLSNIITNTDGYMEIKVLDRQGAGENNTENKQIGNAGIIYMENIIEQAIKGVGLYTNEKSVPHDNTFYAAVNALENAMTGSMKKKLELIFKTHGMNVDALSKLPPKQQNFYAVNYPDAPMQYLPITYSLMAKCYNEVIAPTLEKTLKLIMKNMEDMNIVYEGPNVQDFKIAIVGGFGRYYPVRNQIHNLFNLNYVNDTKMVKMSEDQAELAIAHGACLLSEGIVKIRKTSRLEIGMTQDNGKFVQTAIRYGQEIENGRIYYCKDKKEREYKFWLEGDSISEFWINYSPRQEGAHIATLKPQIKRQLDGMKALKELPVVVGFSMDESEIVTMYVQNFNPRTGKVEGKPKEFPLSRYDNMFVISSFV